MVYEELLEKLNENPKEKSIEAVRLLVKIADNIINNPKNVSIRTLNKTNPTITRKILQVSGGITCLKLMGFQENESSFVLPAEAKLSTVYNGKDALLMWKESIELAETTNADKPSSSKGNTPEKENRPSIDLSKNPVWIKAPAAKSEIIRPIILPALVSIYSDPFLHRIEQQFHNCLRYANKDVLERARQIMPIVTLENAAQLRLRTIQQHVKKNKLNEPNISLQDMLILELLQWFKQDFFSWVDSPDCEKCGGKSRFSHMATDEALFVYTNRIELHRCESCQNFTSFPRYEDLNVLLETRRGRCGEWANVFTLFCCALGWDTRYVLDENDHVWTEVYSIAQKRWLHCDSCENICDKPLVYESGWKKKMTYVIAFSNEEVQDVTWRYSSHHKEVLTRRKLCDETRLVEALIELRKKRQSGFSDPRRAYLTKRLVLELADMLTERKPGDQENQGRQSGESIWRLARGEVEEEESTQFVWRISPADLKDNRISIRYSAANDVYEYVTNGADVTDSRKKWMEGCFSHRNVTRKEETDWKQVYLARKENDGEGRVSWKFEIVGDSKKKLDKISVQLHRKTFETGSVIAKICSGDLCEVIPGGLGRVQTIEENAEQRIGVSNSSNSIGENLKICNRCFAAKYIFSPIELLEFDTPIRCSAFSSIVWTLP